MTPGAGSDDVGREPARQVVALGAALVLTAVAVDVVLAGELTIFFDLCFIATCLAVAAVVRRGDFFLVAVLPPLLMIAAFVFVALVARDAVADPRDGVVQATASGLATHGIALGLGYAVCLGWLGWRLHHEGPRSLGTEIGRELGRSR